MGNASKKPRLTMEAEKGENLQLTKFMINAFL